MLRDVDSPLLASQSQKSTSKFLSKTLFATVVIALCLIGGFASQKRWLMRNEDTLEALVGPPQPTGMEMFPAKDQVNFEWMPRPGAKQTTSHIKTASIDAMKDSLKKQTKWLTNNDKNGEKQWFRPLTTAEKVFIKNEDKGGKKADRQYACARVKSTTGGSKMDTLVVKHAGVFGANTAEELGFDQACCPNNAAPADPQILLGEFCRLYLEFPEAATNWKTPKWNACCASTSSPKKCPVKADEDEA